MDLVDLLAKEFQTKRIKSTDGLIILLLLAVSAAAWITILHTLSDLVRAGQADFPGLQFLGFIASYLVFLIANLLSKRRVVHLFEEFIFNIRYRLLRNLRRMELEPFEKIGGTAFFNVATLDLRYISDIAEVVWYLLSDSLILFGVLVYMASLSLPVFAIILGILILGFIGFLIIQSILIKKVHITRDREDSLFDLIEGLLFDFKSLKIDRTKNDDFFRRGIERNVLAVRDLRRTVGYIRGEANILIQVVWLLMFLFIIFVLPHLDMVDAGTLFSLGTAILLMPFVALMNDLNDISFAHISVDRIFRFDERLSGFRSDPHRTPRPARSRQVVRLAYENLRFNYTDEAGETTFSVGPIDLTFTAGEITFIIGGNGSGKSTLLKLLIGLYRPLTGTVAINGEEVGSGVQRELFSCVFTDFHLFDRFYGLKEVDGAMVAELIGRMGLEHKVSYREGGFSTLDLSTGQRKRLALIAALLEDKPCYIFDEWAADQSPEFREYFYKTILPDLKARNKLIICVTHDDGYHHLADRIHKLELGRLAPGADG
uniref:Putative ATP-binding cassette transporter n=1 Tax=Candidatus Kentrum sp. FW TaxID=2126338 RepID=A0A450S133_9GAMM|nr:MAG: putative ATP-binding cassette transporter [Candidatus Kentron sp. FW]